MSAFDKHTTCRTVLSPPPPPSRTHKKNCWRNILLINKSLCTTAGSKENGTESTEQFYKQLMLQQTSCLRKFLTLPTPPSRLPTLKPKASGRVLTSADSLRALEEKQQKKDDKARKKEENAKKREDRAKMKEVARKEKAEQREKRQKKQNKQSSKSPAGKVCAVEATQHAW